VFYQHGCCAKQKCLLHWSPIEILDFWESLASSIEVKCMKFFNLYLYLDKRIIRSLKDMEITSEAYGFVSVILGKSFMLKLQGKDNFYNFIYFKGKSVCAKAFAVLHKIAYNTLKKLVENLRIDGIEEIIRKVNK
jgi:hypothetical protein